MLKIISLIYAQFVFRKIPTPYFRTIMTLIGYFIFHFLLLFVYFPIPNYLNPFAIDKIPIVNYFYGAILIAFMYLIISRYLNKKQLGTFSFTGEQIKVCSRNMILYFILLLILLALGLLFHIRDMW